MPSLHQTIFAIKTFFKWITILALSIFLFVVIIRIGQNLKEYFFPTPLPPPTTSFGKLPTIDFPESNNPQGLNYVIDTLSGQLPSFPDRINVYQTTKRQPNLLALQRAKEIVKRIGIDTQPFIISDTVYQWNMDSKQQVKLVMDIISLNFSYSSNFTSDPQILSAKNLPNQEETIKKAELFLTDLSLFPLDLNLDKTKTSMYTIVGSEIISATSISNAQLIRIDFFQKDINKLPIHYPYVGKSTMNILLGSGDYNPKVVSANFFHMSNTEIFSTYPIKTAEEAFSELKEGKGYVLSYNKFDKQILIKNVFLAYYAGETDQGYLLPIIVFEGSSNFLAYVEAVKGEWVVK